MAVSDRSRMSINFLLSDETAAQNAMPTQSNNTALAAQAAITANQGTEGAFRLLDLPAELQYMIHDAYFSDTFTIDYDNPKEALLFALRTSPAKEIFENARQTYYKRATFDIPIYFLHSFVKNAGPLAPLIKKIRILSNSHMSPCIDALTIFRNPAPFTDKRNIPTAVLIKLADYLAAATEASSALMDAHRVVSYLGVGPNVLKSPIRVVDDEENIIWSDWSTSLNGKAVNEALEVAGYPPFE